MGLLSKITGIFKRKQGTPAAAPPTVQPIPDIPTGVAGAIAEAEAEIVRLRGLEVKSVSDGLRGKYRAAREAEERSLARLRKAIL